MNTNNCIDVNPDAIEAFNSLLSPDMEKSPFSGVPEDEFGYAKMDAPIWDGYDLPDPMSAGVALFKTHGLKHLLEYWSNFALNFGNLSSAGTNKPSFPVPDSLQNDTIELWAEKIMEECGRLNRKSEAIHECFLVPGDGTINTFQWGNVESSHFKVITLSHKGIIHSVFFTWENKYVKTPSLFKLHDVLNHPACKTWRIASR